MFPCFSISQKEVIFSSNDLSSDYSEDDHYDEYEDHHTVLEDGIVLDETIVDEYDEFEEEMENDIPEPHDSEIDHNPKFLDEVEAEHYDSLEDE